MERKKIVCPAKTSSVIKRTMKNKSGLRENGAPGLRHKDCEVLSNH
jgi:hypothetical protein